MRKISNRDEVCISIMIKPVRWPNYIQIKDGDVEGSVDIGTLNEDEICTLQNDLYEHWMRRKVALDED